MCEDILGPLSFTWEWELLVSAHNSAIKYKEERGLGLLTHGWIYVLSFWLGKPTNEREEIQFGNRAIFTRIQECVWSYESWMSTSVFILYFYEQITPNPSLRYLRDNLLIHISQTGKTELKICVPIQTWPPSKSVFQDQIHHN